MKQQNRQMQTANKRFKPTHFAVRMAMPMAVTVTTMTMTLIASLPNAYAELIQLGEETIHTQLISAEQLADVAYDPNAYELNKAKTSSLNGVASIRLLAEQNNPQVAIQLSNANIATEIERVGNQLIVKLIGATIDREHIASQINSQLANASNRMIAKIDVDKKNGNGLIFIEMDSDFDYQAYQANDSLQISIEPAQSGSLINQNSQPITNTYSYQGEPISMAFQDVPVRSVLDVLAQVTGLNIVSSDGVQGNMTLRLMNIPWDQVLDIILQSQNLVMQEHGNVLMIAPSDEIAEQLGRLRPLKTEYIRLHYAIANDVYQLIMQSQQHQQNQQSLKETLATGATSNQNRQITNSQTTSTQTTNTQTNAYSNQAISTSLLSNRGTVAVDKRTNTLIIKDTADSIANIRQLIEHIDIPVQQVMIEARIVSATDTFSKELGVNWGILSNNEDLLIGGSQQTLWDIRDYNASGSSSYDITRPDNLNVDLGIDNAAGSIAFGLLNLSDMMIDLELSAMQADGRGEVISTPKILTADKQTAKVVSGTQIPYQESAGDNTTATRFIEAALSLEVTPSITPDGKIGMQLHINNDSPRLMSSGVYAIDTNSIETNVIVKNGQTVVLGGVYRNAVSNGENKVPVLGDVPVVGNLFKQKVQSNQKEELLIFVTPKLVNVGM